MDNFVIYGSEMSDSLKLQVKMQEHVHFEFIYKSTCNLSADFQNLKVLPIATKRGYQIH